MYGRLQPGGDLHQGGQSHIKSSRCRLCWRSAGYAGKAPQSRTDHPGGAALALLCFALVWFNFLDPSVKKVSAEAGPPVSAEVAAETGTPAETEVVSETQAPAEESYESDAPIGHETGQQLEDFTLECYDGSDFRLADTRGKVTFINLWATYCTPCIQELPYFSGLYKAHEDDIAMIAVDSFQKYAAYQKAYFPRLRLRIMQTAKR